MKQQLLLILVAVLVVTFMVDSQIGYIADFIPETLSSPGGIAGFIVISVVFAVGGLMLLRFVKPEQNQNSRILFSINVAIQYVLIAILAVTIIQILTIAQYNITAIAATFVISYGLWIAIMSLLSVKFVSWIRNTGGGKKKRNLVVVMLMLSMIVYVVNGVTGLAVGLVWVQEQQKQVVTSTDVAFFPEFDPESFYGQLFSAYLIPVVIAYVLNWIGTVMLLRPYIHRIGRIKFYAAMGGSMLFYLIGIPLFMLGYYTPTEESDVEVMNNILISGIASVLAGISFGAAFLAVAKTLRKDSPLRGYMIIAAYGFILFYIAGSAVAAQAAYPPYGLPSLAFTGLSCYLIYVGLYSAAVSVSQDYEIRDSIRKSVMREKNRDSAKFLESMGIAQQQQERHKAVATIARNNAEALAKETGVKPSLDEADVNQYIDEVVKEMENIMKKKSSSSSSSL